MQCGLPLASDEVSSSARGKSSICNMCVCASCEPSGFYLITAIPLVDVVFSSTKRGSLFYKLSIPVRHVVLSCGPKLLCLGALHLASL